MTDPNTAAASASDVAPVSAPADTAPEASAEPLAQTFAELKLSQRVLESVNAAGFIKPTPIQAQFIPLAMTGQDVMGQAKTGTGKTGSFLLPIFERIQAGTGMPQALILAPTRELALQIHGEIARLGSLLGFTSITLYGGSSYEPQIEALSQGVDIVVGTPGRVMDHMRSGRLDLRDIKVAVLDEADRMLDLGFRKDIEYILKHCPEERQTLLLSATIPDEIKRLAQRFMYDPLEVWTAPERLTVDAVEQYYCVCEKTEKLPVLLKILDIENPPLAIIFCGTKIGAKKLAERLKRLYIPAREIHGDLQQARREKIMGQFRSGKVRLLIATDVASRGIDVNDVTHIFNYDIPYKIEDYVHRIGRTGRMEKTGKAFTLLAREEAQYLTEIELLINRELHVLKFDNLTSKWWPTPPSGPPEGYEADDVKESDLIQRDGHGGAKGGKKKRSRGRGKRDRQDSPRSNGSGQPPGAELHAAGAAHDHLEVAPVEIRAIPQDHNYEDEAEAGGDPETIGGIAGVYDPEAVHDDGESAHPGIDAVRRSPPRSREGRSRDRRRRERGEPVAIVCSACGKEATVRFKPDPSRPIFCSACYKEHKSKRPEATQGNGNAPDADAAAGNGEALPLSDNRE